MKFLKRLFQTLLEPIKLTGSRDFSEKLAKFFTHKGYLIYIIALVVTIIIFIVNYV